MLVALADGSKRHSDLRKALVGVSQKVLTKTLRELERDGLVRRDVTPGPPIHPVVAAPPGALLVDAQVHVWAAPSAERPWRTGYAAAHRREPVGVDETLRVLMDWLWTAASAADLPVMVYPPSLCRQLAEVAARHPDLRLVVDHLALPVGTTAPAAFADLPDLLALADRPNVAVKASALPCHSAMPYPFADLHAPILAVLDAFGPQRVFWGSDWTRLPCAYRDNVTLFTTELDALSGDDLRSVMGEGLLRWLGWHVPGSGLVSSPHQLSRIP